MAKNEDATILISNPDTGKEVKMTVLFTLENDDTGKKYVLFYDPKSTMSDDLDIQAMRYDDDGNLYEIEDDDEWDYVNEAFEKYCEDEKKAEANKKAKAN